MEIVESGLRFEEVDDIYIWTPFLLCVQIKCRDECVFRYEGCYMNDVKLVVYAFVFIVEACGFVSTI